MKNSIDLGLAISALSLRMGESRTSGELAAFCDVSRQAIEKIERTAIRKLRVRLRRLNISTADHNPTARRAHRDGSRDSFNP